MDANGGSANKEREILHKIDISTIRSICIYACFGVLAVMVIAAFLNHPLAFVPKNLNADLFYDNGLMFNITTVKPIRDIAKCEHPSVRFNEDGTYSICVLYSADILSVMRRTGLLCKGCTD